MRLLGRRIRPSTTAAYATLLVLLGIIAFGVVSRLLLQRAEETRAAAAERERRAAERELIVAVDGLAAAAQRIVERLETWDEARQQLDEPIYYAYWRENRLRSVGRLPRYVHPVELYDRDGAPLAEVRDGGMPARIEIGMLGSRLEGTAEAARYLYFAPLYGQDPEEPRLAGYVGLGMDFIAALRRLNDFEHLDPDTLRLNLAAGETVAQEHILERITFTPVASLEASVLRQTVIDAVVRFGLLAAAVTLAFLFMLSRMMRRPLKRLAEHIDALRSGQGGLLADSFHGPLRVAELERVQVALNDYHERVQEAEARRDEQHDDLSRLSQVDALTGVGNRTAFERDLQRLGERLEREPRDAAFVLFDCDHFKAINDSYGRQVADELIRLLAERIEQALPQHATLYRLGGDEFATVLLDVDPRGAQEAAAQCVAAVDAHTFTAVGIREPVHVSAALAHEGDAGAAGLERLRWQADVAMYHAKRPGQGRVAVYTVEMGSASEALVSYWVTNAVFDALASGTSLEMHYQPVVALPGRSIDYYEALIRIRVGDELITPHGILPVVEARRLEIDLDRAVLDRVYADVTEGRIPEGRGVAINVSGPGLASADVLARLRRFAAFMPKHALIIEITETALVTQLHKAFENLMTLRNIGFKVSLDDFGSGYSSLRYLADLPVDIVKFDGSLIRKLGGQSQQSILVENIVRLMIDAGYALVAEGVEAHQTLARVERLGFRAVQGFYVGRPRKTCHGGLQLVGGGRR